LKKFLKPLNVILLVILKMNKAEEKTIVEVEPQNRTEFVLKASECDYNFLWKCQHPNQKGKKCEKICEFYTPMKYD
jgi:hypothetical protein